MKALFFRHHALHQCECDSITKGKDIINAVEEAGSGWGVGVYDSEQKILYLDGFDNIIGADPARVTSRVLNDLKVAGIIPVKLESIRH